MKKFSYTWQEEIYLIHFEFESNIQHNLIFSIVRQYNDGSIIEEKNNVVPINGTFRSIVSRKSSDEISFEIIYQDADVLKAFLVLDRAFYPTTPFFHC